MALSRARNKRPYSLDLDRMKAVLRANYLINPPPSADRTVGHGGNKIKNVPFVANASSNFFDTHGSPIFNDEGILHSFRVERCKPGGVGMDSWPRSRHYKWQGLFPINSK
jgi:hypothetical protein